VGVNKAWMTQSKKYKCSGTSTSWAYKLTNHLTITETEDTGNHKNESYVRTKWAVRNVDPMTNQLKYNLGLYVRKLGENFSFIDSFLAQPTKRYN
jgi:hypothetical protein